MAVHFRGRAGVHGVHLAGALGYIEILVMAYLKLRNNVWFAVWREGGKKVVRSTKVQAKGKKEQKLAQVTAEAMEAAAKGGCLSKALQAVRAVAETMGIGGEVPSVHDYLTDFKPGGKEQNASNYRRAARVFLEFLGAEAARPLDCLTPARCREFCMARLKEVSFGTVKHHISMLKAALNVAVMDELISRNPFCAFSLASLVPAAAPRATKRLPFTREEMRLLLTELPPLWRDVVLASFLTGGQRLGDICCLKWEHVDFVKGCVEFYTGKTGRLIQVPMVPVLRQMLLSRFVEDEEFVFPRMASQYVRCCSTLSTEFRGMLQMLGIRDDDKGNGNERTGRRSVAQKSFHSIRHTVVTMIRESNEFSADIAREIVGHDSEAVERMYFTPSLDAKRRGLEYLINVVDA